MNAEERSSFAGVGNAKIYYEVAGRGHPLVLINAGYLNLRMWDYQVPEFARHFRVVRYDQVGYGRTQVEDYEHAPPRGPESRREYLRKLQKPAGEQGFPTDHGDLRGLLDFLGIEKAHLLGLGTGANLATDFVLNYPDRTSALILVSAQPVRGSARSLVGRSRRERRERGLRLAQALVPEILGMLKTLIRGGDATPLIDEMMKDPSYAPSREQARRKLRQILEENADAIRVQRTRKYKRDPSTANRLDEIEVPMLVTYGERDNWMAEETARLLESGIPGAREVSFPQAGRLVNMDRPEEFNRVVLEFLGTL